MSELTAFEPAVRSDGTLDPDCLARAGQRWVDDWLERRLSGSDRWFPIDPRYGEDPESFVVGIVQDAGLDHPATAMIGRSVQRLLDQARTLAPASPHYLPALLRLCQRVKLPWTSDWFTEEIRNLASAPAPVEELWGADRLREILLAASFQAPALPRTAASGIWPKLLQEPRYATLAFLSFGSAIEARASHLSEWWQAAPPEERSRELRNIIFLGLKNEGPERVREVFARSGAEWGDDLRQSIDKELERNRLNGVFSGSVPIGKRPPYYRVYPYHLGLRTSSERRFPAGAAAIASKLHLAYKTNQPLGWGFTESWQSPGPATGLGPKDYNRSDDDIRDDVYERLTRHGQLDARDISVRIENGEISLEGTVVSRLQKRIAERALESVAGVRDIHNRLRIKHQATGPLNLRVSFSAEGTPIVRTGWNVQDPVTNPEREPEERKQRDDPRIPPKP